MSRSRRGSERVAPLGMASGFANLLRRCSTPSAASGGRIYGATAAVKAKGRRLLLVRDVLLNGHGRDPVRRGRAPACRGRYTARGFLRFPGVWERAMRGGGIVPLPTATRESQGGHCCSECPRLLQQFHSLRPHSAERVPLSQIGQRRRVFGLVLYRVHGALS